VQVFRMASELVIDLSCISINEGMKEREKMEKKKKIQISNIKTLHPLISCISDVVVVRHLDSLVWSSRGPPTDPSQYTRDRRRFLSHPACIPNPVAPSRPTFQRDDRDSIPGKQRKKQRRVSPRAPHPAFRLQC